MKITIVGLGYVGLSLGLLLSQKHTVVAFDTDKKKIRQLEKKQSPIDDKDIREFLLKKNLRFFPTENKTKAFEYSDYFIICTPTNYNVKTASFDTSSVESVLESILSVNQNTNIVIKSTVPIGFTSSMKKQFHYNKIYFSPEFLRENNSLYDNLYPSRIIVGDSSKEAKTFATLLARCTKIENKVKIIYMNSNEAEAVKLFSNTFLAMRVSFFNELDSFAESYNLSTLKLIEGVSSDVRIGNYYNNPSFGYGGYCLPKDTKQLLKNYQNIPNNLIKAVIKSNKTRKEFISRSVIKKNPKTVGIYRLIMKKESENFRESAVLDIIQILKKNNIKVVVYEPLIQKLEEKGIKLQNNLEEFIRVSEVILANRRSNELEHVKHKVYSRDLYKEN